MMQTLHELKFEARECLDFQGETRNGFWGTCRGLVKDGVIWRNHGDQKYYDNQKVRRKTFAAYAVASCQWHKCPICGDDAEKDELFYIPSLDFEIGYLERTHAFNWALDEDDRRFGIHYDSDPLVKNLRRGGYSPCEPCKDRIKHTFRYRRYSWRSTFDGFMATQLETSARSIRDAKRKNIDPGIYRELHGLNMNMA